MASYCLYGQNTFLKSCPKYNTRAYQFHFTTAQLDVAPFLPTDFKKGTASFVFFLLHYSIFKIHLFTSHIWNHSFSRN